MTALHVPGVSIAVIHDGKIEWANGYGVVRLGGAPVTPETLFQAGSISKPVTAMAVMHLVQTGKLNLDTDVNQYLKSWKVPSNSFTEKTKITLRELLSHTAGMTVHGFPGYASDAPLPTLVQVLNGAKPANSPAIYVDIAPGSEWRYSGGGFVIEQQLLQRKRCSLRSKAAGALESGWAAVRRILISSTAERTTAFSATWWPITAATALQS
jgi:CubicO group peptidase (beta-lactamase class C family)